MKRYTSSRNAVTVIEVLFAAGIAIFGLIGIASLISVAGKQASQSNAATLSQALGNQWFGDFVVRGFSASNNWLPYNDQNPTTATALSNRFISFDNTSSMLPGGTRVAYRHAVCIDPLFFSDPGNLTELLGAFPPSQAYRPGLFPYYQDDLDPLSDPVIPSAYTTAPINRPRLIRVALHNPSSTSFNATLTAAQINRMFLSFDDQVVTVANVDDPSTSVDERDPTAPATRRLVANGGQFASTGEYSWFATLCPRELLLGETAKQEYLYTMSLVVTKRRDRVFFKPSTSGVENIPGGERIAYVSGPGGASLPGNFQGGSGGRVQLSASINTSSKLGSGDWVMLSRFQPGSGAVVVRWYRVIGVDAKATETAATWSREVALDGPDWVFDATTQATLVSNVVTVFERVVEIQHQ